MQQRPVPPNTPVFKEEIKRYIEEHGYYIVNPESLETPYFGQNINSSKYHTLVDISISDVADQENKSDDTGKQLPIMYQDLVEFIKQVPHIQQIQLKPLLFAFFYHTVYQLFVKKKDDVAHEFFDKYTKHPEPGMEFHSFHQTDIKKLRTLLNSTTFTKNNLEKTTFHTSLTETTYQALVAFLMDKSYMQFLNILNRYVKVSFVPLNYFTNRMDVPNFLYHSTDQSEDPTQTRTALLCNSPIDLACQFLGETSNFEILDDNPATHMANPFDLPKVSHSRVVEVACDIQNMQHLSKNSLPSVGYFTFQNENISYDINYNGSLIAAATPYGYTQLFATSVNTDIDGNLVVFKQQDKLDIVPRVRSDQMVKTPIMANKQVYSKIRNEIYHPTYYNRTLIGPRTYCCRFSPDSRLIACAGASLIRLWCCEQNSGFSQISVPTGIVWCVDWSPLGYHFVSGTDDRNSWLWTIDRKSPIRLFVGHQEAITDIKYHPNASTIATASYDRSVMLWDIRDDKKSPCTKVFAESSSIPMAIQFSRNGKVVISADEMGKITTWDIGEGRKYGSITAHKGEIRDLAVSIEGTILASAGPNGEICLWDMATLCSSSANNTEPLKKLTPRNSNTNRISFSSRNLLHAIGSIKPNNLK
ncbi:hypothetical protein M9Y10_005658 [Tritrichomonas musculus]|uniref:TFIID subunit TAF5 NTD2 domain-containing protein n=1 Tax=Tritrichomonas musculus TaxID=1915356 RepID=A0ABR2JD59_9EUKA